MPADRNTKVVTRLFGVAGSSSIEVAMKHGAYSRLSTALGMTPTAIIDEVKKSNLRGRGGAGFPTGTKWSFIPKGADTVYLVCNADESEPGTCKDRELLFWDPHLLVEGMILASYALGCKHAYIYIRGEMMREVAVLQAAVDEAYQKGFLGNEMRSAAGTFKLDMTVHRGAGAYICGEETSLLNSLEGKRGWPRMKLPFPAVKGLFGKPTIVNNVETLMNIPWIIENGGAKFAELGVARSGGTRMVCMSGHLNKPGVFEMPIGITFRQLIDEVCGGVPGGRKVKAVIPGGSSMPPLDIEELDVPVEFDALMNDPRIKPVMVRPGQVFELAPGRPLRTMAGSGGIVVMDDSTDIVAVTARIMRFYAHESCGQCTPCREGTGWLARVCTRLANGAGRMADLELLSSISFGIAGNTICPLGEAAAWPMMGFLTKFRADFEARAREGEANIKAGRVPAPAHGHAHGGGAH
jgi:NADH-quinone oxidoreductase subunit F